MYIEYLIHNLTFNNSIFFKDKKLVELKVQCQLKNDLLLTYIFILLKIIRLL